MIGGVRNHLVPRNRSAITVDVSFPSVGRLPPTIAAERARLLHRLEAMHQPVVPERSELSDVPGPSDMPDVPDMPDPSDASDMSDLSDVPDVPSESVEP